VVVSGIPLSDFPTFRRLIPGTRDELKIATKNRQFRRRGKFYSAVEALREARTCWHFPC
jgi:hypothetical protein